MNSTMTQGTLKRSRPLGQLPKATVRTIFLPDQLEHGLTPG